MGMKSEKTVRLTPEGYTMTYHGLGELGQPLVLLLLGAVLADNSVNERVVDVA